ncbi:MAG: hypothetical protein ACLPYS_18525 [Vulcanimicrobiaceae bacterium]
MRRLGNVLAFIATVGLSACGSGGGVSGGIPSAGSSGLTPDADEISAQAQALDPAIRPSGLVNTNWAGVAKPERTYAATGQLDAAQRATTSYHLNDDGGQAGINLTPPTSYVALTATHDIFTPGTALQLPLPPAGETEGNYLYAPTTKGANDACLEIGTSYYRYPGSASTAAYIYFYDFCGGAGATVNVDSTFLGNYVTGATPTRNAHYQLEILRVNSTSPETWLGRLYNVKTHVWDTVYTTQGDFNGWAGRGWTMYETHYFTPASSPVQCPQGLPSIGASFVRMTMANGGKVYFDNTNSSVYTPSAGETSYGAWGSCFNTTPGPTGSPEPASDGFSLIAANYAWSVASTGK